MDEGGVEQDDGNAAMHDGNAAIDDGRAAMDDGRDVQAMWLEAYRAEVLGEALFARLAERARRP
jgi:hypothetical protein